MAAESPPAYIQASSHGAAVFRQALAAILGASQPGTLTASAGGVVNAADCQVTQNGTPNMSVNVAGGECVIPQTNAANGGLYFALNDASVNLAISAANATNPRIDTIVATVNDAAYSGATNNWVLQVLTGTPTSGATLSNLSGKAALSASSIVLAYVLVPANATTIVTADIANVQTFVPTGDTPLRKALIGVAGTMAGSAPAVASGTFGLQAGVGSSESNGSSLITVTYPEAWPVGIVVPIPVPIWNSSQFIGSYADPWYPVLEAASSSSFSFYAVSATGTGLASTIMAYGWFALGF